MGSGKTPANFGKFSADILVGNFGDKMISIDGLWALTFGNGGSTGPRNALFFTAGLDDETHGLFGVLQTIP